MARKHKRAVTSFQRHQAQTPRERETSRRAREAASQFREGDLSLSQAARRHKTTLATIQLYLGVEFPKRGGRFVPVGDRAGAVMGVLGTDGPRYLFVVGSRQRSRVGRQRSAIARLPDDGGDALADLGEVTVTGIDVDTGQRVTVVLETDPDAIAYWQQREPDFFLELYGDVA